MSTRKRGAEEVDEGEGEVRAAPRARTLPANDNEPPAKDTQAAQASVEQHPTEDHHTPVADGRPDEEVGKENADNQAEDGGENVGEDSDEDTNNAGDPENEFGLYADDNELQDAFDAVPEPTEEQEGYLMREYAREKLVEEHEALRREEPEEYDSDYFPSEASISDKVQDLLREDE